MTLGLNDYEFKLTSTGVLLNGSTAFPYVDIDKVIGLDSAPYRETVRDHEGADGGFIDAEFEKGRDIILEGTAFTSTSDVETYLDSLKANFAPVSSPVAFYFKSTGVGERLVYVKPRGVRFDWEQARRIGMTNIQFLMFAEDPRLYASDATSQTINYGGDTGLGLAFSFAFNVDFGGGATPSGTTVNNTGNRPSPPTFIITGPITNPVISNNTVGLSLRFTITLAAGETLTINANSRTVYLNGNINRRNTLTTPDWFFMAPGDNQISFGGLTGTGSTLNISFRSAWR